MYGEVSCYGANDGWIDIQISAQGEDYNFQWSSAELDSGEEWTTPLDFPDPYSTSLNNLEPGEYEWIIGGVCGGALPYSGKVIILSPDEFTVEETVLQYVWQVEDLKLHCHSPGQDPYK